jgi:hypothetical protein
MDPVDTATLDAAANPVEWVRACEFWAIGVFGALIKHGAVNFEAFGGEEWFFKDGAKQMESELQWHTGTIRRAFPQLHYRL